LGGRSSYRYMTAWPNNPAAASPAIAASFYLGHQWRGVAGPDRSAPAKLQRSARFIENVLSENRSEPQRDDTSPFSPPHAAPLGLKRVQKRARYYKQDAPLELASRPFNPVGLARRVRPNSAASLGGGSPVLLTILAHRPPASEHASWATFTPKKWNTR